MTKRQVFDYIAMSLLWGSSFVVMARVVSVFGWVGAVSFRAFIASAVLLGLAKALKRDLNFSRGWKPFAVIGATTVALQLLGMAYALPRIGTALAAIFVATIPLFSMVIGHFWRIEHLSRQGVVGLGLGFLGIVALVGFPSAEPTAQFFIGCLCSIIGAIGAAFGSNYARKHLDGIDSWSQTIGAFFFGGLLTLPFVLTVPVVSAPTIMDFIYLFGLAISMSSICYVLYFRMVSELGPTKAISVEFVVTLVAVLIGAGWLGERLSALQLIGSGVIVVGCLLVLDLVPRQLRR